MKKFASRPSLFYGTILYSVLATAISVGAQERSLIEELRARVPQGNPINAPIAEDPVLDRDDDRRLLTFQEERSKMRDYCRSHIQEPECIEFKGELTRSGKRSLDTICKKDPFHKKCNAKKTQLLDRVYRVDKFCNNEQKREQCLHRRKGLLQK